MRKKKILVLAAMLAVSLSACAGKNQAQQTTQAQSQETSQPQETESAAAAVEAAKITSMEELTFPVGEKVSGAFTGTAYLIPMIMNDEEYNFPQTNNVTFEPGARSYWHSHGGMILVGTGGMGYYQEEGKPAQIIRKGDVPEEAPVTDEEYENLEVADYTPQVSLDNGFMFQRAKEAMESDTFSGPAYVSNIIGDDNVADAPGLHYVVFDPGVINNWHTHEGGQILIATDGIGYHQIEGQPVEVLYPGDVALCPPGEKHWHGGSADTSFAHIAINTNPELTGLEWFDRISDEEYASLPTEKPAE